MTLRNPVELSLIASFEPMTEATAPNLSVRLEFETVALLPPPAMATVSAPFAETVLPPASEMAFVAPRILARRRSSLSEEPRP